MEIISISRFRKEPNSIAFLIKDKFYIINTDNISELPLERNKEPIKLDENWYYYDGVL